jgi:hypothetical protein
MLDALGFVRPGDAKEHDSGTANRINENELPEILVRCYQHPVVSHRHAENIDIGHARRDH